MLRHVRPMFRRKFAAPNLAFICLAWLIIVYYCEWTAPKRAISKCVWPALDPSSSRVALIADPQLVDAHTYPGRNWFFERVTEVVSDRYLARNWRLIQSVLDPDANVFLGDLFDGGRDWDNQVWMEEFERWNKIYPKPLNKKTAFNLAGNHDIGFGDTIIQSSLNRFKSYFGPTSQVIDIAGHQIVLLDTISLSNTNNEEIYGEVRQFLQNELPAQLDYSEPIILCTHVPLFRPPGTSCGSRRESRKDLPLQKGVQYLTQLSPALSNEVLSIVKPTFVFSGDDHDACHVFHNYTVDGQDMTAQEFTCKSASMAMGISAPGIQLLTMNADKTLETSICLMGSPLEAVFVYAFATVASVICLAYKYWPGSYSQLPLAEIKEKKLTVSKYHSLKRAVYDALFIFATFMFAQWVVGRWAYAKL